MIEIEKVESKRFICQWKNCGKTWITKHGRSVHENRCLYNPNRIIGKKRVCHDIEWVLDLYFKEEKGSRKIAKLYSERFKENTSHTTIQDFIKNAGYKLRGRDFMKGKNSPNYNGIIHLETIHVMIRREKSYPYTDNTKEYSKCPRCGRIFKEDNKRKKFDLAYLKSHKKGKTEYYSFNRNDYQYMCRMKEDVTGYKQKSCHQSYDKNSFWKKWTEENWLEYLKVWLPFRKESWNEYCKKHPEWKEEK